MVAWFVRPVAAPLGLLLLIAALLVGTTAWATRMIDSRQNGPTTELHTVTGTVDGVQSDGSGICVKIGDEPSGECFEATDVLNPLPRVGQRVRMVYAEVPYTPGSPASTNRIVAIEILTD
jgi:hypothetical protein